MANTQHYLNKLPWKVVGVSGGPDSMALLDMLRQDHHKKVNLVVVHVNYGLRESSKYDQNITEDYCAKHQISCVSYEAPDLSRGNFQKNARDFRLKAFKEIYEAYKADTLYLAHHCDDHLETIVFELLSQREPQYLGIKSDVRLMGMRIKRPLLNVNKEYLIEYCHKHQIKYGIDETNVQPTYTRNIIRQKLASFSKADKQLLLDYQRQYTRRNQAIARQTSKFLKENKHQLIISNYIELKKPVRLAVLREFFKQNQLKIDRLTKKQLEDLDSKIIHQTHQRMPVSKQKDLMIEYDYVYIMDKEQNDYAVTIDSLKKIKHSYFELNFKEGAGLTVKDSDFPLTIRNARKGDVIQMKYGSKKLNRFFIDRKILTKDRRTWPVIENKEGIVICVGELGCDVDHYQLPYNLYLKRGKG